MQVRRETGDDIPRLSLLQLAIRFLRFGALAWGGPVAQIAMLRRELVDEDRWIGSARFNRTLAVYQALPGPEAQELTIFFGTLARGRLGGILAGLCFVLPGFVLMLGLSWFYVEVGVTSAAFAAAFVGCQAAVLALIVRGVQRIGSRALLERQLWLIAAAAAALALAGMPFVLPLLAGVVSYPLAVRGHRPLAIVILIAAVGIALAGGVAGARSDPGTPIPSEVSRSGDPSPAELFISGLRAGALTFGGAYTAIPFVEQDATGEAGWMSRDQFLDGLALSGVIPAPLVIFTTFVGYVAGGPLGAFAMTIGVFLPAFSITLVGHRYLEAAVANPRFHAVLDGVTAAVVGLIAVTLIRFLPAAIGSASALVIFAAALLALAVWRAAVAVPVVIAAGGLTALLLDAAVP